MATYLIKIPNASKQNFNLLKNKLIWGLAENNRSRELLNVGDTIIFMFGLKYTGKPPTPSGFPRLATFNNIKIKISNILITRVLKECNYNVKLPYSRKYPYTFNIEIIKKINDLNELDLTKEILEGIRFSSTAGGKYSLFEINNNHGLNIKYNK